ncbi:hypothetical protein CW304_11715 [Bacillus sp. UFRGS-B20]|nr:hypothetical protein CW304_11715 [Bacillus sp. UFRGS-B20]
MTNCIDFRNAFPFLLQLFKRFFTCLTTNRNFYLISLTHTQCNECRFLFSCVMFPLCINITHILPTRLSQRWPSPL